MTAGGVPVGLTETRWIVHNLPYVNECHAATDAGPQSNNAP